MSSERKSSASLAIDQGRWITFTPGNSSGRPAPITSSSTRVAWRATRVRAPRSSSR